MSSDEIDEWEESTEIEMCGYADLRGFLEEEKLKVSGRGKTVKQRNYDTLIKVLDLAVRIAQEVGGYSLGPVEDELLQDLYMELC